MPAKTPDNKINSAFESADASPGFLLWQVTSLWQRAIRAALEPIGLTHVQFVLLVSVTWLEDAGVDVTQVRLAAHAKTDIMMTSKVVRTLEQKGLVTRQTHPTDTRAKAIGVTQAGRALAIQSIQVVEQADRQFFAVLGGEQGEFIRTLQVLL